MDKITLEQVRQRSAEGRFFRYYDWRDRLFVPLSIVLAWVFLRLSWSGNSVSLLSGAIGVAGAGLMACGDPRLMVVGSFGSMAFYLLDYVDGAVARIQGRSGIGGQYVDWTMHAVVAVSTATGLLVGALPVAGLWIIPFGLLAVVAATLTLDRYSVAWFAICMHYQQQRAKSTIVNAPENVESTVRPRLINRTLTNFSRLLFHENYAIFTLPILAGAQWALSPPHFDFRVFLTIMGGCLYCPVVMYDIWIRATEHKLDTAYRKLFFSDAPPHLPQDHFLP